VGGFNYYAQAIAVDADRVYVGGDFIGAGLWPQSGFAAVHRPTTTGIEDPLHEHHIRLAASPNPFSGRSTLQLTLAAPAAVDLEVFDVAGRLVRRLKRGPIVAGRHHFEWDGRDRQGREVGPGVYFAKLTSGTTRLATKIVKIH
jgi:hypothetical protein